MIMINGDDDLNNEDNDKEEKLNPSEDVDESKVENFPTLMKLLFDYLKVQAEYTAKQLAELKKWEEEYCHCDECQEKISFPNEPSLSEILEYPEDFVEEWL